MIKQCREYEFLIAQFVDGEMEEAGKAAVLLHLAECGSCRLFWETLTDLKMQAAQQQRLPAPPSLDVRVSGIARNNRRVRSTTGAWRSIVQRRLFMPAPVAVVLALLLVGGGAGIAFAWIPKPAPAKEVIEPVVCIKLPTVEVRGGNARSKQAFR